MNPRAAALILRHGLRVVAPRLRANFTRALYRRAKRQWSRLPARERAARRRRMRHELRELDPVAQRADDMARESRSKLRRERAAEAAARREQLLARALLGGQGGAA
jgi:hypothetical protein